MAFKNNSSNVEKEKNLEEKQENKKISELKIIYTFNNASKFQKKKFVRKSNLFRDQTFLGTNRGVSYKG